MMMKKILDVEGSRLGVKGDSLYNETALAL